MNRSEKEKLFDLAFPSPLGVRGDNAVLAMRIVFGIMMLVHGIGKIVNFSALALQFPDPLGVGGSASLALSIFAEVACCFAFLIGFLTRPACVVMIVNMLVAVIVVHHLDILGVGELAFLYLAAFVTILYTGAGGKSVDALIQRNKMKIIGR